MKMINLLKPQTAECKTIPTTENEAIELKRSSFNEGWWKGLVWGAGSWIAGEIIGTMINNKFRK